MNQNHLVVKIEGHFHTLSRLSVSHTSALTYSKWRISRGTRVLMFYQDVIMTHEISTSYKYVWILFPKSCHFKFGQVFELIFQTWFFWVRWGKWEEYTRYVFFPKIFISAIFYAQFFPLQKQFIDEWKTLHCRRGGNRRELTAIKILKNSNQLMATRERREKVMKNLKNVRESKNVKKLTH